MSTQTQKTPAQLAEDFLRKYATVIGTLEAIDKSDKTFLLKYATVVGSPKAIKDLPDAGQPAIISDGDDSTGSTGSTGGTNSNDDAGVGEGTDNQGD